MKKDMETKQTAVDWLDKNNITICELLLPDKISQGCFEQLIQCFKINFEQAKQMEKEQIMDAYKEAEDKWEFFEYEHRWGRRYDTAEKYYNEQFGK